jgi:hypothetical protein
MSKETTYAGMLGDSQRLVAALQVNAEEVPHLEVGRVKLESLLEQGEEIGAQQSALTASKQEASRKLKTLVVESRRLTNVLRLSLKEHYGIRSEKLAEFGLKPFRGRTRKAKPTDPGTPPSSTPAASDRS